MGRTVEAHILPGLMEPIGPYSHLTVAGDFLSISAIAGVDPKTGALVGGDIESQTAQILKSIKIMLTEFGSDFDHLLHINVYLSDMSLFDRMNAVYADALGASRPARSVVSVSGLPKRGALVTMGATAVKK